MKKWRLFSGHGVFASVISVTILLAVIGYYAGKGKGKDKDSGESGKS